jgi:hypothetical protein
VFLAARFWVFDRVLGITVVLVVIFGCMGVCHFIFWIVLLLWFYRVLRIVNGIFRIDQYCQL